MSDTVEVEFDDELDEELHSIVDSAKQLIKTLKRPKDLEIARRLLDRIEALNTNSLEVKSNRNKFARYFIQVLKKTSETQPEIYAKWFKPSDRREPTETALWSSDRRTFVATKSIPGVGLLIYMAVTHQPEWGWQDYGFLSYDFMANQ